MKIIFFTFLIFGAVTATPRDLCVPHDDHFKNFGVCDDKMVFLDETTILASAITSPFPANSHKLVSLPSDGVYTETIQCIKVQGLMNNDNDGCPYLRDGGYKHNTAILQLISQKGKEMKFNIKVFSCPKDNTGTVKCP